MNSVLIIGGGALGLLSARELALAGVSVTLLERGEVARESSWAGGGILSPLYPWRYLDSVTRLATWSQDAYATLCPELEKNTGIDPEYVHSGLLIGTADEQQAALDWAAYHQRTVEIVDQATIRELEPARESPPAQMLWMPEVHQVRNPRLTKALHAEALRLGISIHTGQAVTRLENDSGRITRVRTDSYSYSADQVLVCAGAWSGDLLSTLMPAPDIRPVRGQMILFKTPPGTITRMVLEENRYIIPRRDGRVLFGSTIEEAGYDKSTTREARNELVALARKRFPVLGHFEIESHWAGLRPGSPAGVPYIARHPDINNLFVNAGQFRNGLVLGPASARLVVDLMLQRDPCVSPAPYTLTAPRG